MQAKRRLGAAANAESAPLTSLVPLYPPPDDGDDGFFVGGFVGASVVHPRGGVALAPACVRCVSPLAEAARDETAASSQGH